MSGEVVVDRQEALLAWWSAHGRHHLPWRQTRDPWAVLVSELMLQQTQVARVIERYHAFLARFPDPSACAAAGAGEVLRAWTGLGYNRRALQLHRAAEVCVDGHGGRLPTDLAGLLALPGVGPYTARAVLAFAHEADVAVVDTNVARVLARWEATTFTPARVQEAADRHLPVGEGWAWNQAMFDLGAGVCTRRAPRCGACPVRGWCGWGGAGAATPDPADGSAGVAGGQSRFEGSDRQGRGRLVEALRAGSRAVADVPALTGWTDDVDRATRVLDGLVAEGLVVVEGDRVRLP